MNPSLHNPKTSFAVWLGFSFLLVLAGGGLLILFSVPYATIKAWGDLLAKDGNLEVLTIEVHQGLQNLRLVGALGCLLGLGVLVAGKKSIGLIDRIIPLLVGFWKRWWADFRSLVAALQKLLAPIPDHYLLWAGIFPLTIISRLYLINRPMRYDEAYTFVNFASKPFIRVITDYSLPNNHIFHSVLVHISYQIFGSAHWAVRLPALLAGILCVAAGYLFGRAFFNRTAALLGAGLIGASQVMINYSNNARGYTILCLVIFCVYGLGAYVKKHNNLAAWGLMTVLTAVGFYTHPVMLMPFGAFGIWMLFSWWFEDTTPKRDRTFFIHLALYGLLTTVITIMLYAPVAAVSGMDRLLGNSPVSPIEAEIFWTRVAGRLEATWNEWTKDIPAVFNYLLVIGLGAGLLFHKKIGRHRFSLLTFLLLFVAVTILIQRVAPASRVWVFIHPLLLIWGAAGLVFILDKGMAVILPAQPRSHALFQVIFGLVLIFGLGWPGLLSQAQRARKEADPITMTSYLSQRLEPGDVVVTTYPNDATIRYYFHLENVLQGTAFDYQKRPEQGVYVVLDKSQTLEMVLSSEKYDPNTFDLDNAQLLQSLRQLQVFYVKTR